MNFFSPGDSAWAEFSPCARMKTFQPAKADAELCFGLLARYIDRDLKDPGIQHVVG